MKTQSIKQTLAKAAPCLLAMAAGLVAWLQLELADAVPAAYLAGQWPVFAPLNALTAFCLTLALYALLGRWGRATTLSGVVFTVLAVANYYTRDLHGSALMPQDILNLGTAAEVMGSYTLQITPRVVAIVLLVLPVVALGRLQARLAPPPAGRPSPRQRGARWGGCALAVFAILYLGYFSPWPVRPVAPYGWSWQEHYYRYGYLAGTVDAASLLAAPLLMPAGYTDAAAEEAALRAADYTPAVPTAAPQDYPDIVLILSESLYDFSLVTDLQADAPVLPTLQGLANSVQGHTVSPNVGGGTNSSEYELLTSNSLMLMPSITPFNWLDLDDSPSIVRYLKGLGYATLAAHPYTATNYRRDAAWQALGFDETHFGEDFPTQETYGQRPYQTDSATYRDLEALYEAMPAGQPRFAFLVSIQSHGDYDMNDASLDLVHAGADYGRYDAEMDEYLSCVKLSDEAFGELAAYFTRLYEQTGRRVLVAIAGDHAPSFVDHVADQGIATGTELQLLERSTPFVIWANYPLEATVAAGEDALNRVDLCSLAPLVAEQAGLPLDDYYRYLLAMRQAVAVQTGGNDYLAADGTVGKLGDDPQADEWMQGYFYLEYRRLSAGAGLAG